LVSVTPRPRFCPRGKDIPVPHWTLLTDGQTVFHSQSSLFAVLARRPAGLTEIYRSFPQSLRVKRLEWGNERFLPHSVIQRCRHVVCSRILAASLKSHRLNCKRRVYVDMLVWLLFIMFFTLQADGNWQTYSLRDRFLITREIIFCLLLTVYSYHVQFSTSHTKSDSTDVGQDTADRQHAAVICGLLPFQ